MADKVSPKKPKNVLSIIIVLILIFLFLNLLPDSETIKESFELIQEANMAWVLLGIIAFFFTVPFNSLQLNVVSFKKLNFWLTFKVQMAIQFVAKFFPSSVGGFILNSFYLIKMKHTPSQAASVIAMKALTSSISFIGITLIAIIFGIKYLQDVATEVQSSQGSINAENLIVLIGAIIILAISLFWVGLKIDITRKFLDKTLINFWNQLKMYKNRQRDFIMALIHATGVTVFAMLTLYASAKALGLEINFTQTFLIYSLGCAVGALIPTPGGIGAAEAGLYTGFTLLGFSPSASVAAVTLYRIISFWLPTIPGLIFFINLRKDLLKNFSFNSDLLKRHKHQKSLI